MVTGTKPGSRSVTFPAAGKRGSTRRSARIMFVLSMDGKLRFPSVQIQLAGQCSPRNPQQFGGLLMVSARLLKGREYRVPLDGIQAQGVVRRGGRRGLPQRRQIAGGDYIIARRDYCAG